MATTGQPLMTLLRPADDLRNRWLAAAVLPMLALSAVLIVVAAGVMPDGYSWQMHSISESAAQGLEKAWIARMALLLFGAAVLVLAVSCRSLWPRATYWANLIFAGCMFGAAAFSHKPWISGVPGDGFEDFLHSVSATLMGFVFVAGVIVRFGHRSVQSLEGRWLDMVALLTATAMPLILASVPAYGGVAQRIMFLVAYIWFAREAMDVVRPSPRDDCPGAS